MYRHKQNDADYAFFSGGVHHTSLTLSTASWVWLKCEAQCREMSVSLFLDCLICELLHDVPNPPWGFRIVQDATKLAKIRATLRDKVYHS